MPDSDFSGQFHAFGLFQAREIAAGRLPLWSPGSYGGFPFAADTQAAAFYPPRWLTILLSLPWGFPYYALEVEGIAHIWLAGVFTHFLAYSLTRERLAGLVATVAFGLGGYLTSYPLLQLAILETITWLPLILLLLHQGIQRRRPLPWLLAAALALAMSALAGHPQTFLHVSYVAAAYYLFLSWRARWRWPSIAALGATVVATAAGTAAVAWLPAVLYLARTTRSNVTYEFVSHGFPLLDYVQVLVPRGLSFWAPQYVGMAAICLALFAWWGRKMTGDPSPFDCRSGCSGQARRRATGEIVFWSMVALVAAWISLGDKGILFELVYHVAPGFSLFRQQERLAGIVGLSLALLAAQAVALWLRLPAAERRPLLQRVAYAVAGGLLLAGLVLALARQVAAENWLTIWLRQWLVVGGVLVLLYDQRPRTDDGRRATEDGRRATGDRRTISGTGQRSTVNGQHEEEAAHFRLTALILLLALDLTISVGGAMNLQPESPAAFWPQPAWLDLLDAAEPARLDSRNLFHANLGEVYGLEDVRGLSPLKPRVLEHFEQLPRLRRWQLLNVTHVLAQSPIEPALTEVGTITQGVLPDEEVTATVYRFEEALPRAWMSYRPVVVEDTESAFQILQDPGFDPAVQVVLQAPVSGLETIRAPASTPQVHVSRRAANALAIEVTTATPGLLVISEWAYPGWRATVNGSPAPLQTANYALQALLLPAGAHTVELRFIPPGLATGAAVTVTTLLLAAILSWRWSPQVALRGASARKKRVRRREQVNIPGSGLHWLVTLTLLFAFALRLYTSATQELRADEAFSALFAGRPAVEIIPGLIEVGETLSPFHYLALHTWIQLAGNTELALRYLSVSLSVLLLALMVQVGRQLGGKSLGLLLLILMATSQSLVWVGQDVRNTYAWTPLLEVAATLVLLAAPSMKRAWPRRRLWGLYALLSALTVYSHYFGVFALVGHGLFLLFAPGRRRFLPAWAGSGLVALLLFAPWPLLLWSRWLAAGHLTAADAPELAQHLVRLGRELAVGSAFDQPIGRWLFLGALIVALYGAYELKQRKRGWAALLLGWLASAALFMYLFRFQRAVFNDYYISLAAPAWWALVATGLLSLWRSRAPWQRLVGAATIVALLGASGLSLSNYYLNPRYNRTLGYRPIAAQIAQWQEANDVFLANAPDPSLTYYLADVDLPRALWPSRWDEPATETEAGLAQLAAQYDRIWFVPATGGDWDEDGLVLNWLNDHTLPEWAVEYQKLSLRAYRPLHAVDQVLTPLDLPLDGTISLEGVFATVDGAPVNLSAPVAVRPGSVVNVTLVWQALSAVSESYTVFVHLLDENGALLAQHDGVPVAGARHTFTWSAGERLIDVHTLTIPAGATFSRGQLVAGMYHSETISRLHFADGRDAIPVAEIRGAP